MGQKTDDDSQKVHTKDLENEDALAGGRSLQFTEISMPAKKLTEWFYDMKLAGDPLQCLEEDGTCDALRREIDWAPFQWSNDLNQHKFLLDIDGNGWRQVSPSSHPLTAKWTF